MRSRLRSRLQWLAQFLPVVLALLTPASMRAQTVRGIVVDQGSIPVAGVVVLLLDSLSKESARALSNASGEFRLTTARPGSYRLRTMRIGFRPFTSAPMTIATGQSDVQRIVLANVQLALDTVKVVAKAVCRVDRDSLVSTFAVWEQVRTALNATQLTGADRGVRATAVSFERTLDRTGRSVLSQTSSVSTRPSTQAWRSASPDSLHRGGYVLDNGNNGITYFAPSLEVLLSEVFLEDHCFRLKTGKDKSLLGMAFEPAPTRKKTAELSGTMWLDRGTSQLRKLEFRYENILSQQQAESGGEMEFVAMRDGSWAISRWSIRMPVLERAVREIALGGDQLVLAEIHVSGGELSFAVRGADTLWARPPLVLSGDVVDSVSNRAIADAVAEVVGTGLKGTSDAKGHFTIAGLLPGEYTLEVHTPSLDSVSAAHQSPLTFTDGKLSPRVRVPAAGQILASLCKDAPLEVQGIVAGTVTQRGAAALPGTLRVVAEWTEEAQAAAAGELTARTRWRVTRPGARGAFRFCGLPLNASVVVQVEVEGANAGNSEPARVRMTPTARVARADLVLDQGMTRGAVLAGVVLTDSAKTPVAEVEVLLPELSLRTLSNDRGEFRLRDIPPGTHRVVIRRVGYGPVDTPIEFASNQTIDRRVLLSRVTVVDSVVITADRPEPWRRAFEENRKLGFGQFLTREELEKKESQTMMSVLSELRRSYVKSGASTHSWMTTRRGGRDVFSPSAPVDLRQGARPACYSDVWLDNLPIFTGRRGEPLFDLSTISPGQIETIEWYADLMQLPANVTTHRDCGVLIIHSRTYRK